MITAARAAVVAAALVAGAAGGAQAQANQRGEIIAYSCSGCHGHDFKGSGGVPLLRGRNADELSQMMTEFRAGQRYSTVMRRLALGLDEADMRAVSDYLAGLR